MNERLAKSLGLVSARQLNDRLATLEQTLNKRIERRLADMTVFTAESEVYQRLAAWIATLRAENNSLSASCVAKDEALAVASVALADVRSELDREQASRAEEVKRIVDEALALDAQLDTERINALLNSASEALPVTVPEVPATPDAGAPAEIPAEAPIDPVVESSLPNTTPPVVDPNPITNPGGNPVEVDPATGEISPA